MKTDRFADIIRRKLESIRPEFTDKDWKRMQATLDKANLSSPNQPNPNNPFSGGIWTGKTWLAAAASVSTVALLSYSIWQQREINQLHNTIGELKQSSTHTAQKPDVTPSNTPNVTDNTSKPEETLANRNEGQSIRPDTVYITRYVRVPSRAEPNTSSNERIDQQEYVIKQQSDPTLRDNSSVVNKRQDLAINKNPQSESNEKNSTSSIESKAIETTNKENNLSTAPEKESTKTEERYRTENERVTSRTKPTKDQQANATYGQNDRSQRSGANAIPSSSNKDVTQQNYASSDNRSASTSTEIEQQESLINAEQVASLPLSMGSKNWGAALAQQARRMRPARTVVVAAAEPTKAPESRSLPNVATHFRVGVGGEIASPSWNAGIVSEVLLGKHWVVSAGFSQANSKKAFVTEEEFDRQTRLDFRKEFVRPADVKRDVLNIDMRLTRLQIPISLGYRIPLSQSISLVPSVGTYLNLTNTETITYSCLNFMRPPQKPQYQIGVEEISGKRNPPIALVNRMVLGTGIEWQNGHWVAQASPLLSIMTQSDPKSGLNWQDKSDLSIRLRLLYQF